MSWFHPQDICPARDNRMSEKHYIVECHSLMRVVATAAVGLDLLPGDMVILRFKGCDDIGVVKAQSDDAQPKAIAIRKATEDDLFLLKEQRSWEAEALNTFKAIVKEYEMPMRVVDVHGWIDRQKIAFYFLSEHRLDFRKLHKEVSLVLGCRVVIKQIGIRDHARLVGGLGPCGRPLCCTAFLAELRPISLRSARRQNLYVNPDKISGMCGRLLCCLRFEDESYAKLCLRLHDYAEADYDENDEEPILVDEQKEWEMINRGHSDD